MKTIDQKERLRIMLMYYGVPLTKESILYIGHACTGLLDLHTVSTLYSGQKHIGGIRIQVKPLSYISDKHLLEIAKIEGIEMPQLFTITRNNTGEFLHMNFKETLWTLYMKGTDLCVHVIPSRYDDSSELHELTLASIQKLYEWGYALPYGEYSVQDLVDAGIYELNK